MTSFSVFSCEQGSEEWYRLRMGIPTASEFKTIVGIKKDAKDKKTRQIYMRKLAGERIRQEPMEQGYINEHMQRGKDLEHEARATYAFHIGIEPQTVGFIRKGSVNAGCSPDCLIPDDGGAEIKCCLSHIQLERLQDNVLPPEFHYQIQGNLWITGRKWWDFISYCRGLRLLVLRVYPDKQIIKEIEAAVKQFNLELDAMVKAEMLGPQIQETK